MVKLAALLGCCLLFGCDRGFDDVPAAPQLPDDGGIYFVSSGESTVLYYDPTRFRGNDVLGEPFPLTVCPDPQVMVGLSVATNDEGLPVAMSLRCAALDASGVLGPTTLGPRIGAESSAEVTEEVIDCPAGWLAASLRGGEVTATGEEHPHITTVGLECAEAKGWLRGLIFPTYTMQVGVSAGDTRDFTDGCLRQAGVLKGLSGRVSDRIEQVCISCIGVHFFP